MIYVPNTKANARLLRHLTQLKPYTCAYYKEKQCFAFSWTLEGEKELAKRLGKFKEAEYEVIKD